MLTRTQKAALEALEKHGGSGILTKTGTMLARGAILGHGEDGQADKDEGVDAYQRSTWMALAAEGRIREVSPRRYEVVR